MKKISEMTAGELTACICKMAEPAEKLYSDNAVIEALESFRSRIPDNATLETTFSIFTGTMIPVLTGKKHKADVYAILAALCDQTAEEVEKRNGVEVMRDLFIVFALDKDVETLFRPCFETRG